MELYKLGYSKKNIPIPPQREYMENLLEKNEVLIKIMRWKAYFYLNKDSLENTKRDEHYGLRSRRSPPHIPEIKDFENDLVSLIQRNKFKKSFNRFQKLLKNDIRKINSSKDIIVAADKTRNMYKMSHEKYDELVSNSITLNYGKAEDKISYAIATECKNLSRKHNIENHLPSTKLNPAFITIKDHKENFTNNAKCRLINPTKPEIGKVGKNIVDKVNVSIIIISNICTFSSRHKLRNPDRRWQVLN